MSCLDKLGVLVEHRGVHNEGGHDVSSAQSMRAALNCGWGGAVGVGLLHLRFGRPVGRSITTMVGANALNRGSFPRRGPEDAGHASAAAFHSIYHQREI